MGRLRGGRSVHPGLRDRHQRRPGPDGRLQDRHHRRPTTGSTSTGLATTAASARAWSTPSQHGRHDRDRSSQRARSPTAPPNDNLVDCGNWGVSASWAVPTERDVRHLHRPADSRGRGGDLRQPHRLRRPRRRRRLRPPVPDLRHDLAGVQPVRRLQPLRRTTGSRPQGQLQPAVHDARRRGPRTGCSTPSTRWSAGWSATATTSATSPTSTPTATARRSSSTRPSCRSGHDEYWSAGQRANVEAARDAGVDLAFFSGNEVYWKTRWEPSSADGCATPLPDARRLQGRRCRPSGSGEHWDCYGNFACDPDPDTWTGLWRQNAAGPRRRAARERPDRPDQLGQQHHRHPGPGGLRHEPLLAEHRRSPARRARARSRRHPRLRVGRVPPGVRDGLPRRAHRAVRDDSAGSDPPAEPVPRPAERRARLRRRHGPVVVGPRRRPRPRRHPPRTRACSRRRSTCSPTWAPSPAPSRPAWCPAARSTRRPRRPPSPSRPRATPSPAAASRSPARPPTPAASSPRSRSRPTAAPPGDRATGTTDWSLHLHARPTGPSRRRRAPSTTRPTSARRRASASTSAPQTCPCSIFTPSTTGAQDNDTERGRARRQVPVRRRRLHHRDPVLQDRRQHRDAHRAAVDHQRRRTWEPSPSAANRQPAGRRRPSRRPIAIDAGTTYVASYHTTSGHYAVGDLIRLGRRRQPAAPRPAGRSGRPERRVSLRRRRGLSDRYLRVIELPGRCRVRRRRRPRRDGANDHCAHPCPERLWHSPRAPTSRQPSMSRWRPPRSPAARSSSVVHPAPWSPPRSPTTQDRARSLSIRVMHSRPARPTPRRSRVAWVA